MITNADLQEILGLNANQVKTLVRQHGIGAHKIGRVNSFNPDDLRRYADGALEKVEAKRDALLRLQAFLDGYVDDASEWMPCSEAAELLACSKTWVLAMMRDGAFEGKAVGDIIVLRRADVEKAYRRIAAGYYV